MVIWLGDQRVEATMNSSLGLLRSSLLVASALSLLGGCASPPQIPVQPAEPPLIMEEFFAGVSDGEGVFVNSWTGTERRFQVVIAGFWDGKELTLVEDFDYADGEKDRKTWRLQSKGPGTFTGTREDVVGRLACGPKTGACAWNTPWSSAGGPSILPTSWCCVLTGPCSTGQPSPNGGFASEVSNSCCASVQPETAKNLLSVQVRGAKHLRCCARSRSTACWRHNGTLGPWRWMQRFFVRYGGLGFLNIGKKRLPDVARNLTSTARRRYSIGSYLSRNLEPRDGSRH